MRQPIPGAGTASRRTRRAARSAPAPAPPASASPPELRAVIDAMPEAVLVCDPNDRIRIVNPAADRLFAGHPVVDGGDLMSRFEPQAEAPSTGTRRGDPVVLRPRALPNRWFELRTFPVERAGSDDATEQFGRIIVLRDVTSAREEQAERRAFLSILSHELRTPITTIYAGSRVLARRDSDLGLGSKEIASDISAEAARLYDVVEDLLVLTRAEQDLLELTEEPVLLQRVVESALRVAHSRVPDAPIVVAGDADPPAVLGDAVYVEQIVRNLVTAATRYGHPGAPVVIRLGQDEDAVTLSVLDRGPDLTPAELKTSFALTDDGGTRASGVGIALFVCRRLVEAMHGRVWVKAREDGGAEFGFALPRYQLD